jgi:hypothetical protein
MKVLVRNTLAAIVLSPTLLIAAEAQNEVQKEAQKELHRDVKRAMAYTLPEMKCDKPSLPGVSKDVVDPATGAVNRADVDSYTLGRYERQEKRWMKCLTKYKSGLVKDFGELRDSASHGLTEEQAKMILGNMANIQAAMESPIGIPGSHGKDSDDS